MKKVLLIEDERNISRFIELELKHEHFDVTVAFDGRSGLEIATQTTFDIILLDVMLPHLNGIEVCRRIRMQSNVPILLITARDAVMDRVAGLDAGADDYVVKPFAIEELLARIRSTLRRVEQLTSIVDRQKKIQLKTIEINQAAHQVFVDGTQTLLTKTEYDLLLYLVENKNHVCTRDQILEAVWGFDSEVETNVIDVYIRHLRTKLPKDTIETVRGVGYVIRQ